MTPYQQAAYLIELENSEDVEGLDDFSRMFGRRVKKIAAASYEEALALSVKQKQDVKR